MYLNCWRQKHIPRHSCGMFDASTSMVDRHNANRLTALVSIFEEHFSRKAPATQTDNHIKDTVIIFGHVARHLDSTDCCIPDIVERLFEARKALPDLSPLVKLMRPKITIPGRQFNGRSVKHPQMCYLMWCILRSGWRP